MWENFPTDKKKDTINKKENQIESSGLISKLFSWFK